MRISHLGVVLATLVVAGGLAAAPARAGNPPPSAIVTVSASGALDKYPPWMVIDSAAGETRAWCVERGVGATITLTFDQPIPVTEIEMRVGQDKPGGAAAPDHVQVTAGTQTVDADQLTSNYLGKVPLNGSAVTSVTVKIISLPPVKANRACISNIRVLSPSTYFYGFVTGFDRAALTALAKTTHDLDAGLRTCDAATLGAVAKGPIAHTHFFATEQMNANIPAPKTATYKTAADLVAACQREGSPLATGYAGGSHVAALADDLPGATSPALGEVIIGDNVTHGWRFASAGGAWKLTEIVTSEPIDESGTIDLLGLVTGQLDAVADRAPPKDTFTDDASFVVVDPTHTVAKAGELAAALGLTDSKHDDVTPKITLARDGETAWASTIVKYGKREFHVSTLLVKAHAGWRIAAGFWAEAQPNAAVDKAAAAGKASALAALPALSRDDDLLSAVHALATGPLDKVAAARADLVAFGSGPGERTTSGRALAGPWAAAWAKHVTLVGAVAGTSPSGRTAWIATNATLDKGKAGKVAFRLFLVFDRAGSGAWSLVHVQFAVPAPPG